MYVSNKYVFSFQRFHLSHAYNGKEDIFQSNISLHLTIKHYTSFFTHFYSIFTTKKNWSPPLSSLGTI